MSDEEYDFEYSDEEEEEPDVELENTYYSAKALKATSTDQAIAEFAKVVEMEQEKGEWGFRALKQMIKLLFGLHRHDEMFERYRQLLDDYTASGAVTQNVSEKGIDSILDHVSSSSNWDLLNSLYETTLSRLSSHRNERLWFKTNLKLGQLLRDTGDIGRLHRIVKELLKCCQAGEAGDWDGPDVIKRGTQLLEVYTLEIQLHSLRRDTRKLKELYHKALRVKSGIPHPRTMAVLQECGGKMYMQEKEYDLAIQAFFQSFKSYDETGEPRRLVLLKYLVLATMLHQSKIDPFDSQEVKPYKDDKDIVAMRNLIRAFQEDDVKTFEKILKLHHASIMGDPFIQSHIDDLLRTIRTQVMIKVIAPYQRISIRYLAQELNGIPEQDVESLLVSLILDRRINGHIDQVNQILVRGDVTVRSSTSSVSGSSINSSRAGGSGGGAAVGPVLIDERMEKKFAAVERWADSVGSLLLPALGR